MHFSGRNIHKIGEEQVVTPYNNKWNTYSYLYSKLTWICTYKYFTLKLENGKRTSAKPPNLKPPTTKLMLGAFWFLLMILSFCDFSLAWDCYYWTHKSHYCFSLLVHLICSWTWCFVHTLAISFFFSNSGNLKWVLFI